MLLKAGAADYRPRPASTREDQSFVPLRTDDTYAVRLINDSDLAAGVELAIDGLEICAFSDDPRDRGSRMILPARSSAVVVGWYRNNGPGGSNEFLVSEAARAAALQKLPRSSARLGIITATFAAAWPRNESPPLGEQLEDQTRRDGVGTTLGPPVDQVMTPVDFVLGRPKASVTVRYDRAVEPADPPNN